MIGTGLPCRDCSDCLFDQTWSILQQVLHYQRFFLTEVMRNVGVIASRSLIVEHSLRHYTVGQSIAILIDSDDVLPD